MWISDTLYEQILECMPIPCVDLVISDSAGHVLLVKRINEPAQDQWWFPGGRIGFGETRLEAAKRKLSEECGLVAEEFVEAGTFDFFFPLSNGNRRHVISTVFEIRVPGWQSIKLDRQSSACRWVAPGEELVAGFDPFIGGCIEKQASRETTLTN